MLCYTFWFITNFKTLQEGLSTESVLKFGEVNNGILFIYVTENEAHNLPFILVSLFFNILGLPFLMVCSNSLYSKLTRKESQGE